MTSPPTVLFDLDGTLTDSRPGILRTLRHAFRRLGERDGKVYQLPADEDLGWMIGPPLRVSFARLGGAENVDALVAFYRERYADTGLYESEVYEGVPQALADLRAAGARLYVATSKNVRYARKILEHFGLADYFAAIHGSRDDGGLADKTELLHHVLAIHSLDPKRATVAMIGDREYDMIGARNNAIIALGALWGYGGAEELRKAGADVLIDRPTDVPASVTGL